MKPQCNYLNRKAEADFLSNWQQARLIEDRKISAFKSGNDRTTVLAYHFWPQDLLDSRFDALECAILETWRHNGIMRTVIVVNTTSPGVVSFAESYAPWVDIQVEPTLQPGNLYSMSIDCNSRLHTRFKTEYLLIVQNDGFPLRPGLDHFVGKHDFIGAPNVRNKWYLQLICRMLKCQVCNGGFSLRSHKICEMAAYYWGKKYNSLPDISSSSEDYFISRTLPLKERDFRKKISMPTFTEALAFAYEAVFPFEGTTPPFGFHSPLAFKILHNYGMIDDNCDQPLHF